MIKSDVLVFGAHPDDAELGCGGTILSLTSEGKKVGVIDLTRGELGTRGSIAIREQEAATASKILGISWRENLELKDGFFEVNEESSLKVVQAIRKYRPDIIIANAINDRHPDHGKGADLLDQAWFIAGLRKVVTKDDEGNIQPAWRPTSVYHYIQSRYINPDFIVDISSNWNGKMEAIRAYKSQFYDPNSDEPPTFISDPSFIKFLEARARDFGTTIGVDYGEGFTVNRAIGVNDITSLI